VSKGWQLSTNGFTSRPIPIVRVEAKTFRGNQERIGMQSERRYALAGAAFLGSISPMRRTWAPTARSFSSMFS
jgi:hypothetical protein